jgi:hypothetical protein
MLDEWLSDLHLSETPNQHQDSEDGNHHEIVGAEKRPDPSIQLILT